MTIIVCRFPSGEICVLLNVRVNAGHQVIEYTMASAKFNHSSE